MKILFFGDIVGKIGRHAVVAIMPTLQKKYQPDFVIANAENIAHGKGVTRQTLDEVSEAGVNFFTSGNHVWAKPEALDILEDKTMPLIRPANYPPGVLGRGAALVSYGDSEEQKILVINLMGRVFINHQYDCPFRAIDAILDEYKDVKRVATVVDFHAEATSEKVAFGLYVTGRVSAVVGTHTHVPTADAQILGGATAYVSDVGMVGAKGTVIGVDKVNIIKKFLTQLPAAHEIPEHGPCLVNAVLIMIDDESGKAVRIEQILEEVEVA